MSELSAVTEADKIAKDALINLKEHEDGLKKAKLAVQKQKQLVYNGKKGRRSRKFRQYRDDVRAWENRKTRETEQARATWEKADKIHRLLLASYTQNEARRADQALQAWKIRDDAWEAANSDKAKDNNSKTKERPRRHRYLCLINRSKETFDLKAANPPRVAEKLLYLLLPKEQREYIPGDLIEEFLTDILPKFGARFAKRWYWWQAFRSIVYANMKTIRYILFGGGGVGALAILRSFLAGEKVTKEDHLQHDSGENVD